MREYFKLQYKLTNRKIADFWIQPIIGYLCLLLGFVGLSMYLFYKTNFAPYIYILISIYFLTKLSETKRNDFLKICFSNRNYRTIRILENMIITFPFIVFLIYKLQFYPAIILIILSILLALLSFKTAYSITLPTPFFKKPFEFTVGFRNTFYLFIIAYFLSIIAVVVDNFNLGIFSLMLVYLSVLTYYFKPENKYYVWSYALTPIQFLGEKIKTSLLYASLLCSPIALLLGFYYFNSITIILLFMLLGYLYLITIILAKYSAYPEEINLTQAIPIGISLVFPVILIAIIPFLIDLAIKQTKDILS